MFAQPVPFVLFFYHLSEFCFAGHDCCETVRVALCASREGHPVLVVAEESFQFVQDEAYDAAQFLATCAGNQQALNFTRFLDRSRPPAADVDFLDEKVALAFRHLKLPAEWNVLGADQSLTGEDLWGTVRFAGWERGEKPGRKGSLPWELSMYFPKAVVASVPEVRCSCTSHALPFSLLKIQKALTRDFSRSSLMK